jgi:branched-subunit amino acid aminotransferase/4-amino-4-deoxychorismate lyase
LIIRLCERNEIPCRERNLSLTEMYTADEVFTTGTMGELTPVLEIDGRRVGSGEAGTMTRRLGQLHADWVRGHGEPLPF